MVDSFRLLYRDSVYFDDSCHCAHCWEFYKVRASPPGGNLIHFGPQKWTFRASKSSGLLGVLKSFEKAVTLVLEKLVLTP